MLGIPRRYSHFVFGIIQSGLTSLVAAGIASFPAGSPMIFVRHWMVSWLIAWAAMLPVVLLAAPAIRAFSLRLTREERDAAPAGRHEKAPPGGAKRGRELLEAEVLGCNTIAERP